MRGRMVHELTGAPVLQPYGQRAHEVIYSVGRADLNRVLIEAATRHAAVTVHFNQAVRGRGPCGGPPAAARCGQRRAYASCRSRP